MKFKFTIHNWKQTNKHRLVPSPPKMCILFHLSCFSLLSPCYKFLECLNTVPCSKFVSSSFVAFILHHYFFCHRSISQSFIFFICLILLKEGRMEKCLSAPFCFHLFFLLSWLKMVYPKYASPTKVCIYWEIFSTYKQKDKLSHRKGCYVGTGYKTGFKHCIFKGTSQTS